MCRDNNHGGRRCPHDTNEARRRRRHRQELHSMYSPTIAARQAPAGEKQPVFTPTGHASLNKIQMLKQQIEQLETEYQRIYRDPFSIWDSTPYIFEGATYRDSVQALAALDAAIESRIIQAGDNIVALAVTKTDLPETAVGDHVLQKLTALADEKDAILNQPMTDAEHAEITALQGEIDANERARKTFEHNHRHTYRETGKRSLEARVAARLEINSHDNTALELNRDLVGFKAQGNILGEALRDAKNRHDPRVDKIDDEVKDLLRREGQVPSEIADILRTHADAYHDVLAQVRPFGGEDTTLDVKSDRHARTTLAAALAHYPTAWIEASNAHGPIRGRSTSLRAHYQERQQFTQRTRETQVVFEPKPHGWEPPEAEREHWQKLETDPHGEAQYTYDSGRQHSKYTEPDETMWVRPEWEIHRGLGTAAPSGNGWQRYEKQRRTADGTMQTSHGWRRPKYKMLEGEQVTIAELTIDHSDDGFDPRPGFSTALHEYAHRVEFTGPALVARMEEQFLKRRTTHDGVREDLRNIYPGKPEFGYFDRFVNDYMGKVYEGSRSREILSMGMESVFAGSQGGLVGVGGTRQDPEMKRFILGLLAIV